MTMTKPKRVLTLAIMPVLLAPASLFAEEGDPGYGYEPTAADHIGEKEYSPYLNIGYPQRIFWGDTHLHTSYSTGPDMTGSTDSHTSLATTDENNYFRKAPMAERSDDEHRFGEPVTGLRQQPGGPDIPIRHVQTLSSGLAAVWAKDNTREAVWDALNRKEVYATTGTRITVRVFAGWEFDASEVQRPHFAAAGYLRGVPMGSDLHDAPKGKAPTFMIRALRDVDCANLNRVQIVKG
jgi:hypothetical protein